MSAIILQLPRRQLEQDVAPRDVGYDGQARTAKAIFLCLSSLLKDAEAEGLKASAAALRLAVEVVQTDLRD